MCSEVGRMVLEEGGDKGCTFWVVELRIEMRKVQWWFV